MRACVATLFCVTLIASGGGGGAANDPVVVAPPEPPTPDPTPVPPPPPEETFITVTGISIDSATLTAALQDLDLSQDDGTIRIEDVRFAIDPSHLTAGMSNIGHLEAAAGDVKLVARQSSAVDVPQSGTAEFVGSAVVQVNDGSASYALTMDATTTINFGSNASMDVVYDNVGGGGQMISIDGIDDYAASGDELISLTGLQIDGAVFSDGGDTSASATGFGGGGEILLGDIDISVQGVFAGDDADEIGATAGISGDNGELLIIWTGSDP